MKMIKAKATIDLGRDASEGCVDCPMPIPSEDKKGPQIYYPSLYLSDIDGIEMLPQSGKAIIEYRIKSKTTREDGDDNDADVSIEMEVMSITPDKIVASQSDESESGDAMEKLMENVG